MNVGIFNELFNRRSPTKKGRPQGRPFSFRADFTF
jgi:hypothetical protein